MIIKKCVGKTDKGQRREKNEDFFLVDEPKSLYMLADGMGGHKAGEIASQLVCEYFSKYFNESTIEIKGHLINNFKKINQIIYEEAQKHEELRGMGTTFVACYIDEQYAHFCHAGDVRAYCQRNNDLIQITEDHSTIALLLKNNLITKDEVKKHPLRGRVNKAIGIDKIIEPDYNRMEIEKKDKILLCSDGLWNMLDDDLILKILKAELNIEEKALKLISEANRAGGKDNISVLLIEIH